jgi:DtxR family Mn-dependent transcriptional regulator
MSNLFYLMLNSLTEENYLKALFALSNETDEVTVNELSKRLGIKMPTVTSMMKKLSEKKLVLVEVMGFGWEEVHEIAEQVEHIQSPEFFEKMDEMLGYPKIDPHGSPIPDKSGKLEWKPYKRLSDCKAGDHVKLAAVLNSSAEFLKYLNTRNLKLGTRLRVKSVEKFDGSMILSLSRNPPEMMSHTVCEMLIVEDD